MFMGGKIETERDQEDGGKSAGDPNDVQAFELAERKPRTADGTMRNRKGTKSNNSLQKLRSH